MSVFFVNFEYLDATKRNFSLLFCAAKECSKKAVSFRISSDSWCPKRSEISKLSAPSPILQHPLASCQDEIEYSLLKLDERQKTVKLSLRGPEVMESLRQSEQVIHAFRGCTWHQEYGSWMLEGTPDLPYGGYTMSLASDLVKSR